MKPIIIQFWTETERGWGQRPDGLTLHKTTQDRNDYVKYYNETFNNKDEVPDEYTFADGDGQLWMIDEELFNSLTNLDNQNYTWQTNKWFTENKNAGKLTSTL